MKVKKSVITSQSSADINKKALESITDPTMRKYFKGVLERTSLDHDAQETAEELKSNIPTDIKSAGVQEWLPVCPMPTDLCRVSPFFPLNKKDLTNRPFIKKMKIADNSWGKIFFTGPKLSTYEEDVLMAILALLNDSHIRSETTIGGRVSYSYEGTYYPLLKLIDGPHPNQKAYNRVYDALGLLSTSSLNLQIIKHGELKTEELVNILTYAKRDHETKQLKIVVNPYFYEIYMAGNFTLIEIEQRLRLSSPVAKALHRFVMSHRDNTWHGHFETLADSLNIDKDQPKKQKRRLIKSAINQLKEENILTGKSTFISLDVVRLERTHEAIKRKKALKK
jgi:hypothetical protein